MDEGGGFGGGRRLAQGPSMVSLRPASWRECCEGPTDNALLCRPLPKGQSRQDSGGLCSRLPLPPLPSAWASEGPPGAGGGCLPLSGAWGRRFSTGWEQQGPL